MEFNITNQFTLNDYHKSNDLSYCCSNFDYTENNNIVINSKSCSNKMIKKNLDTFLIDKNKLIEYIKFNFSKNCKSFINYKLNYFNNELVNANKSYFIINDKDYYQIIELNNKLYKISQDLPSWTNFNNYIIIPENILYNFLNSISSSFDYDSIKKSLSWIAKDSSFSDNISLYCSSIGKNNKDKIIIDKGSVINYLSIWQDSNNCIKSFYIRDNNPVEFFYHPKLVVHNKITPQNETGIIIAISNGNANPINGEFFIEFVVLFKEQLYKIIYSGLISSFFEKLRTDNNQFFLEGI